MNLAKQTLNKIKKIDLTLLEYLLEENDDTLTYYNCKNFNASPIDKELEAKNEKR